MHKHLLEYVSHYNSAPPQTAFGLLFQQRMSFAAMLEPMLDRLEAKNGNYTREQAAKDLTRLMQQQTAYRFTETDAAYVLTPSEDAYADHYDPDPASTFNHRHIYTHGPRLATVLAPQNYALYGTGTHTAVPVYAFTVGP